MKSWREEGSSNPSHFSPLQTEQCKFVNRVYEKTVDNSADFVKDSLKKHTVNTIKLIIYNTLHELDIESKKSLSSEEGLERIMKIVGNYELG